MLRLLLTAFTFLIFTACTTSNILITDNRPPKIEELPVSTIVQIPVPVRENGYSHFDTKVLTTQAQFDSFIKKVKESNGWNNKKAFIDSLTLTPIDFKRYNLLLYRITENSTSTVLAVDTPKGENKKHIYIKIGRDKPETATTDMAYYTLAYRVNKTVQDVTFTNGVKSVVVQNRAIELTDNNEVPKSCLEWYDGCNDCGRVGNEGDVVCTERQCIHHDQFKCTKWK